MPLHQKKGIRSILAHSQRMCRILISLHLSRRHQVTDKDKLDLVHRDAVHTERVRKEQRHQKLHTEFSINPYRKLHILPDKPMCRRPAEVIPEDEDFIKAFRKAHEVPTKKYSMPLTESQEIGWVSAPLVPESRQDTRFNFFRFMTDVTKHHEFGQRIKN